MAFTYTLSENSGKVRLRIGDAPKEQTYSLSDDEIDAALDLYSDVNSAAVLAHEWFMARLANYIASPEAGGQTAQLNQRYDMHKEHHKTLVARAAKGTMSCYAGGIEKDRIDDARADANYPDPFARIGRDDIVTVPDDTKDPC